MIKTFAMRVFSSLLIFAVASTLFSQNPISPMGVYIADPTGRVDKDGRLYVYGSLDKVLPLIVVLIIMCSPVQT